MKKTLKTLILATGCAFFSLTPLKAFAGEMYDKLYVFGDSLSDGFPGGSNYYTATNGAAPPSYAFPNKRYTNGQIWPEFLASKLGLLNNKQFFNFAIAGAFSGHGNARSGVAGKDLPGVLDEVDSFVAENPVADPNALYIIYGSVNDYFYGGEVDTSVPVANIVEGVTKLAKAGAKDIVVFNSGALQLTPGAKLGESVQTPEVLKALVEKHNTRLNKALQHLNWTLGINVTIIPFDIYSIYIDQVDHPNKYGYTDVTSSCVGNPLEPTEIPADCQNHPEKYMWHDNVHFSSQAYSVVADAVYSKLKELHKIDDNSRNDDRRDQQPTFRYNWQTGYVSPSNKEHNNFTQNLFLTTGTK